MLPQFRKTGASRIFPAPPLSGVSYFIEMGEPSAQVPFNVNWRWSPTIWNVSVSEVTLEDFAGFSFQVPTKGLLWASSGLGAIAAITTTAANTRSRFMDVSPSIEIPEGTQEGPTTV